MTFLATSTQGRLATIFGTMMLGVALVSIFLLAPLGVLNTSIDSPGYSPLHEFLITIPIYLIVLFAFFTFLSAILAMVRHEHAVLPYLFAILALASLWVGVGTWMFGV